MRASFPTTDPSQKEDNMGRKYEPTSLRLRSVFVACAVTVTVAVVAFIDMLASDHGAASASVARPIDAVIARA
jgi:hypothetical protein